MNHLAIVYLKTSSNSSEKISVGLFGMTENERFFSFSKSKVAIADKIIEENVSRSVMNSLQTFKLELEKIQLKRLDLDVFGFNKEAIKYLNIYSKGILEFEELKTVSLELNNNSFNRLFNLIIDNPKNKKNIVSFNKKVKSKLSNEAFKKIDINYAIDAKILNRYTNHKVDFIGKNGGFLAGKAINFDSTPTDVDKNLMEFHFVTNGLLKFEDTLSKEKSYSLDKGFYSVYFIRPESEAGRKVLDKVRRDNNKLFDIKELDSLDSLASRIKNSDYVKFSEFLKELG